jgi:hypothetical protein
MTDLLFEVIGSFMKIDSSLAIVEGQSKSADLEC